jgi:DNA-binding GntR family transcriptional regulator
VADTIRLDILLGRVEPGSRLAFAELSAKYGISTGVLREALIRLVDRGIVRSQVNIGFTVMSLSPDNLRDLTNIRALTEPKFARQSVAQGSVEWESELVAAHHLLARTPYVRASDESRAADWMTAHANFHLKLVAGANSARMVGIVGRLRDEAELYRRWYGGNLDERLRAARLAEEHRAILDAATDRDADRVDRLTRQHIERSAEDLLESQAVASLPDSAMSTVVHRRFSKIY